ncbi:MAG: hypothetical protein M1812_004090 [Candelaria pacifica]|nr:MAG: hypothetical protein M1812_004090 [Candelaria pacifica]
MPSDDLKQHATSDQDFYALLGISSTATESDLRRAYRKTALKYHPDKNADNPSAVEKFHLLQIAYDVLSDPTVKAAYDNARAAKLQKKRQNELFEGKRRQMKENLEMRERGAKRSRDESMDAEEKLEMEIRRLAEDGKRRRKEREELLRRDKLEEQDRADAEAATSRPLTPSSPRTSTSTQDGVPSKASKISSSTSTPNIKANGRFKLSEMGNGVLKSKPSFSSFSTPTGSPFGKTSTASPSLEEITMRRLKLAEKKRLEDEIRRQDEEAASAEA